MTKQGLSTPGLEGLRTKMKSPYIRTGEVGVAKLEFLSTSCRGGEGTKIKSPYVRLG